MRTGLLGPKRQDRWTKARAVLALGLAAGGCQSDSGVIEGRAVDRVTGAPLAGAAVGVVGRGERATTSADGSFIFWVPSGAAQEHALSVSASGYLDMRVERVLVPHGRASGVLLELFPDTPPASPADPAVRMLLPTTRAPARGDLRPHVPLPDEPTGTGQLRRALTSLPGTIRIWRRSLDSGASSCSGRVDTIPFEKYVSGVLPHEWIPSWDRRALEMGAVAIRTYAAYWVRAGGKYDCADLDDTTASQVYKDEFLAKTDSAVAATAGIVVVKEGSLVLAEYSAENGDPTAAGVSEPYCTGLARNGHGRGTCQWGTQRWATREEKEYPWMASHYYPGAQLFGQGQDAGVKGGGDWDGAVPDAESGIDAAGVQGDAGDAPPTLVGTSGCMVAMRSSPKGTAWVLLLAGCLAGLTCLRNKRGE
ncbi:MAG: hypothetical protein HY698_06030 [Deltaproteobacteria bacterium]|nr:hypothetical protein [Deltaproteobacteria bacterium]